MTSRWPALAGAVAMAALALGTGASNAVAATGTGGYEDLAVVCAPGAVNVCAHVQEQPGDSTTAPQIRGQGTADTGNGVTIVQVTLTKNMSGAGGSSSTVVASTTQAVTSGTQLTATTAAADEQCSYKITSVSYATAVQYRVGTGPVQTVTATGGGNCFPF
ncbi:hypothetical protein K7472_22710 [Streptomyces sp. PTM05]|uniref:Secreted protein n=1 Tax=Streptantibioticus parmotrematis TaxID=2873249 RepID=A0ABS7QWP6_9ACTN|nr:hypothetical protein [Streptantibioticus parmotrematis]MBY8887630.1 hypothetical protein [Streptantibioticus parmotrematis]